MHTDTSYTAPPEAHFMPFTELLDHYADAHASAGNASSASIFRAMAASWRATERELHEAQTENTALMLALDRAHANAQRLEDLATATLNVIARVRPPLRRTQDAPA